MLLHLHVGLPALMDLGKQSFIHLGTRTAQLGVALPGSMAAIARPGNLQNFADGLDPVGMVMLVNKLAQNLNWRPNSADTKKTRQF